MEAGLRQEPRAEAEVWNAVLVAEVRLQAPEPVEGHPAPVLRTRVQAEVLHGVGHLGGGKGDTRVFLNDAIKKTARRMSMD